jgi:hypothetical protein
MYMMMEDSFYKQFDINIEIETTKIKDYIERFKEEREYVQRKL